jgi:DNA-binding response OmpR family regulator
MIATGDDTVRAFLAENLQADGYQPVAVTGLKHARSRLVDQIDVLIVDLESDTLPLIDRVRAGQPGVDSALAIVALTESVEEVHRIRLLDRGADDVLMVPFSYPELRARLAAVLRRTSVNPAGGVLRAGLLRLDVRSRRVWVGDAEIAGLPAKEYELLRTLIAEPDRVFTRSELLEGVWGLGGWSRSRTLDSHAARLRGRLNVAGECFVRNVWGVGYRLTDTGQAAA